MAITTLAFLTLWLAAGYAAKVSLFATLKGLPVYSTLRYPERFLVLFAWVVFYLPNYLGHPDNYIPADPLKTPAHIVPEWYFLPFYAILRAFTGSFLGIPLGSFAKLFGVLAMFAACLLYTSDAADERSSVDLGGRRIIKKKQKQDCRSRHAINIIQYTTTPYYTDNY